jgi:hypothetical protein
MRTTSILLSAVAALMLSSGLAAQGPSCQEVGVIAKMASASSVSWLATLHARAGSSYQADIVFAVRAFELQPKSRTAATRLLALLPKSDDEVNALLTLGDSLCEAELIQDMRVLSRIRDRSPHAFANAVLIDPTSMLEYVRYGVKAVRDPHSDYAIRMQAVCKAKHAAFTAAVAQLPEQQMQWFTKKVLEPNGCRALALPEADQ